MPGRLSSRFTLISSPKPNRNAPILTSPPEPPYPSPQPQSPQPQSPTPTPRPQPLTPTPTTNPNPRPQPPTQSSPQPRPRPQPTAPTPDPTQFKKLFLVGFATILFPDTMYQLFLAFMFCLLHMLFTVTCMPYRRAGQRLLRTLLQLQPHRRLLLLHLPQGRHCDPHYLLPSPPHHEP